MRTASLTRSYSVAVAPGHGYATAETFPDV